MSLLETDALGDRVEQEAKAGPLLQVVWLLFQEIIQLIVKENDAIVKKKKKNNKIFSIEEKKLCVYGNNII